jgi:hypothetical protein
MMPYELGLRFDDPAHVVVFLNEDGQIQSAPAQPFTGPLDKSMVQFRPWAPLGTKLRKDADQ